MSIILPDVSHHHPVKDWKYVKANCPFLASKATQGLKFVDPTLSDFVKGCERNKIPYWLYGYMNKGDELMQAKFLVAACKNLVGSMFVGYVLDCEEDNSSKDVQVALNYISKESPKVMLYIGYRDYKRLYKGLTMPTNAILWEARYGANMGVLDASKPCHSDVGLHQYTSKGICAGVSGNCDLNRLTGNVNIEWFTNGSHNDAVKNACPYEEPTKLLKLLSTGEGVKWVQWMLNHCGVGYKISETGNYNMLTAGAVLDFQRRFKLELDGKVGNETRTALKKLVEK